jgi:hypothetical protein
LQFIAWLGAVIAAFALARRLGTEAVGQHHRWVLSDSWLFAAGALPVVLSLLVWWLWHTNRLRRSGVWLRELARKRFGWLARALEGRVAKRLWSLLLRLFVRPFAWLVSLALWPLIWLLRRVAWRFICWVRWVFSPLELAQRENTVEPFVAPVAPPVHFDLNSAVLLMIDTSAYSPRVTEHVSVADGYYTRVVRREFMLPGDTDQGSALGGSSDESGFAHLRHAAASKSEALLDRLLQRELEAERERELEAKRKRELEPEKRTFLLPLVRIRRGKLIDNLSIRTEDGRRIGTLNIGEYYGLIEWLIQANVLGLTDRDSLADVEIDDVTGRIRGLVRQAQFTVAEQLDEGEDTDRDLDAEAAKAVAWINEIEIPDRWTAGAERVDAWYEWRNRFRDFCKAIRDAHLHVVPIECYPNQRVVLEYTYTQPYLLTQQGFGARDRTRYHLGLRPHEHHITVTEHRWAQSYHLEFIAPDDQYIHECRVVGAIPSTEDMPPGSIVSYSANGLRASDYAHVYIRESDRARKRERGDVRVDLDCREKPPGLLGNVMVIALAEAVLIWAVGWRHNHYFQKGAGFTADLPALLLAAPGLVVGWVGVQLSSERLRSTSMATMFGLILCGLIAIFSTAAALFKAGGGAFGGWIHVDHPWWLGLMLLSAAVFADLFLRLWVKSRRFLKVIRANPDMRTDVV